MTPGIVVQALKHSLDQIHGLDQIRVGFTVSRKVGNAVVRNRARRRLKAMAEEFYPKMMNGGWDIVLIGRTVTLERDFGALRQDFQTALKKLKVLMT